MTVSHYERPLALLKLIAGAAEYEACVDMCSEAENSAGTERPEGRERRRERLEAVHVARLVAPPCPGFALQAFHTRLL